MNWTIRIGGGVLVAFLAAAGGLAQQAVPEIAYDADAEFLKLPPDVYFGEVAGVAVNSKGHVFVFSRGNTTGPAYGATAAQLLEFDADGKFVREIGKNLYAWSYAHTRAGRSRRQHLGRRQGLRHGRQVQPGRASGDGVRPEEGSLGRSGAVDARESAAAASKTATSGSRPT